MAVVGPYFGLALVLSGCQMEGIGSPDKDILRHTANDGSDASKQSVRDWNQSPESGIDIPQKLLRQRGCFGWAQLAFSRMTMEYAAYLG